MEVKRFVASMYIIGSNACKSLGNKDIISEDPVELARDYIENNVDELLIFDLSKDELDKEKAHQIIMDIIKLDEVPVSVAGNIAVIEDANRLLDNGCAHVVLNCTRESNIDMLTELSVKYGYEKISAAITNIDQYLGNRDLIEEFTSRLVIMQEDVTRDILKKSVVPMLIPLADIPLERLIDFLEKDAIIGVFGTVVNSNIHELNGIKMLCSEKGIRVNGFDALLSFDELKKNSDGLVPCIVQDYKNGDVLMMAYMNEEAYNATIRTGRMNYYSRSRNSQWLKGETSGHFQYVKSLYADCDKDTLLAKVSQVGAACHTGSRSCFFNEVIIRQ